MEKYLGIIRTINQKCSGELKGKKGEQIQTFEFVEQSQLRGQLYRAVGMPVYFKEATLGNAVELEPISPNSPASPRYFLGVITGRNWIDSTREKVWFDPRKDVIPPLKKTDKLNNGFLVKFAKDFSIKDLSSSDLWHAHVVSPRFYHDIPLLRYGFDNLPQFREPIFYYLINFYKDAIKALLQHHSDVICQLLYDGLNHKASGIRTASAETISSIDKNIFLHFLVKGLDVPEGEGLLPSVAGLSLLLYLPSEYAKLQPALGNQLLEEIKVKGYKESLLSLTTDSDSQKRFIAVKALGEAGFAKGDSEVLEAINRLVEDTDSRVSDYAAKKSLSLIAAPLEGGSPEDRLKALETAADKKLIGPITMQLFYDDPIVREEAGNVLKQQFGLGLPVDLFVRMQEKAGQESNRARRLLNDYLLNEFIPQIAPPRHLHWHFAIIILGEANKKQRDETLVEEVLSATRSIEDPFLDRYIADFAGKVGGRNAFRVLVSLRNHTDSNVQQTAIINLGQFDPELKSTPYLFEMLDSGNFWTRCDAVKAIGLRPEMEKEEFEPSKKLKKALELEPNFFVRQEIVRVLSQLAGNTKFLVSFLEQERNRYVRHAILKALINSKKIKPPVRHEPILRCLNQWDQSLRWLAAQCLVEVSDMPRFDLAEKLLIQMLDYEKTYRGRDEILKALRKMGKEWGTEVALNWIQQENRVAKGCVALGYLGAFQHSGILIKILRNTSSTSVRRAAIMSFGMLQEVSAAPLILELLSTEETFNVESDPNGLRFWSVFALGRMRYQEATEKLKAIAQEDSKKEIRQRAKIVLFGMGFHEGIDFLTNVDAFMRLPKNDKLEVISHIQAQENIVQFKDLCLAAQKQENDGAIKAALLKTLALCVDVEHPDPELVDLFTTLSRGSDEQMAVYAVEGLLTLAKRNEDLTVNEQQLKYRLRHLTLPSVEESVRTHAVNLYVQTWKDDKDFLLDLWQQSQDSAAIRAVLIKALFNIPEYREGFKTTFIKTALRDTGPDSEAALNLIISNRDVTRHWNIELETLLREKLTNLSLVTVALALKGFSILVSELDTLTDSFVGELQEVALSKSYERHSRFIYYALAVLLETGRKLLKSGDHQATIDFYDACFQNLLSSNKPINKAKRMAIIMGIFNRPSPDLIFDWLDEEENLIKEQVERDDFENAERLISNLFTECSKKIVQTQDFTTQVDSSSLVIANAIETPNRKTHVDCLQFLGERAVAFEANPQVAKELAKLAVFALEKSEQHAQLTSLIITAHTYHNMGHYFGDNPDKSLILEELRSSKESRDTLRRKEREELSTMEFREFIEDISLTFESESGLRESKIRIDTSYDLPDGFSLILIKPKFEGILEHIFSNACKGIDKKREKKGVNLDTIEVYDRIKIDVIYTTIYRAGWIKIRIHNAGASVPKDYLDELQDWYDNDPKLRKFAERFAKGKGIGLFITRQFLREHKGTMTFDDVPEGFQVTIYLPIEDMEEEEYAQNKNNIR